MPLSSSDLSGYDWGNLRMVQSDCDDLHNYSQLTGAFEALNCTAWGWSDTSDS
jgi:hypothetical protein